MTQARGEQRNRGLVTLWCGLLAVVLALVNGVAQAKPLPAATWAFDLLARVEGWRPTGPLDFLRDMAKGQPIPPAGRARIQAGYGRLPMRFELNLGQTAEEVKFVARGPGHTLFLTADEAVLTLRKHKDAEAQLLQRDFSGVKNRRPASADQAQTAPEPPAILRVKLVGTNARSEIVGIDEFAGKVNYLRGNDPKRWRTGIPTYGKVKYAQVYPGIDLIYYGNPQQLEHDFVVAPGANPSVIAMDISGAGEAFIDSKGDLLLASQTGEIRLQKPIIYQEVDGLRRDVAGGYALKGRRVSFQVGAYDASRPLVIDPVLIYSTYLGGSGQDEGCGIAVDAAGNAYVVGNTNSIDFPGAESSSIDSTNDGGNDGYSDIFVAKINAAGTALVYSTYLGGSGVEEGRGVAVDADGNAYVVGITSSIDFPVVAGNSIQPSFGGLLDAFVAKINAAGTALDYSTYLGGSSQDKGHGIAVDAAGNAYVTGWTGSPNFPVMNPLQSTWSGDKYGDAFVTKINAAGTALVYSTYLGTGGFNNFESGKGIAVDATGNTYVTGSTTSTSFPGTASSSIQSSLSGTSDAFVIKINAAGTALGYSTYLGGSDQEGSNGIAVDAAGNAYVVGTTNSTDFPLSSPLQSTYYGGDDNGGNGEAFVAKINAAGTALVYSTYLGGSGEEVGNGIAVDAAGNAYVIGMTSSTDFPLSSPLPYVDSTFMAKINAAGTALDYSTYLGGSSGYTGTDGFGIAVDAAGNVYVVGTTSAPDFPLSNPLQPALDGGSGSGYGDAFVAKIASENVNTTNTPAGVNVAVQPVDSTSATTPVTLAFSTVAQSGLTTLASSTTGPAIPSGFRLGDPPLYYDISTTAIYTQPVTVCISYDPARYGNPSNLRLLHYEGNAWLDVTTSHDATGHVICGQVGSFSPFVVAQTIYNFTGFFRPVDNPPTLNLAKAGRAIPVKFSLGGNQGLDIFAAGYPKSQAVSCDSTAPVDSIDETVSASANGLSYDTGTGQYTYVWMTSNTWSNTCRQLVLKLSDGTLHWANFKFAR